MTWTAMVFQAPGVEGQNQEAMGGRDSQTEICPHQVSICEGASKGEGLAKAYVKGEEIPESENKDCSSG